MSHLVTPDFNALPAAMLDLAKQHLAIAFDDDDVIIAEYLTWSIGYCQEFWGFQVFPASVAWTPEPAGLSRYQVPVQPVSAFTVMAAGIDISSDFALERGELTEPVFLVKRDGGALPVDATVNLTAGFAAANTMPPAARGNIFRIMTTLYQNRESISTLSLEQVPFWLNDMLHGLWIPRA